ncbi:MAG: hypothetical protein ACUVQ2_05615 [Dissulfurimicrobium sp.]|uniref:hypothetical protein n=1 Tax=Dissulfurimicrobium sp. TaxID=2022436 RepID=UPI00404A9941
MAERYMTNVKGALILMRDAMSSVLAITDTGRAIACTKVGCKGPETFSNSPVVRFNDVEV